MEASRKNYFYCGVITLQYLILFLGVIKVSETCFAQFDVHYVASALTKPQFVVNSSEDCCQACKNDVNCTYWTFYKSNGNLMCTTKYSGSFAMSRWEVGMISGAKENPTCGPREYDFNYGGNDIPGHAALPMSTADECCSYCSNVPEAKGWTQNGHDNLCYCKWKMETKNTEGITAEVVSGILLDNTCGTFKVTTNKAIDQTEVETVMTISGVSSKEKCAKECIKMMGCRAAEFRATVSLCQLTNYNPDVTATKFKYNVDPNVYLLYI